MKSSKLVILHSCFEKIKKKRYTNPGITHTTSAANKRKSQSTKRKNQQPRQSYSNSYKPAMIPWQRAFHFHDPTARVGQLGPQTLGLWVLHITPEVGTKNWTITINKNISIRGRVEESNVQTSVEFMVSDHALTKAIIYSRTTDYRLRENLSYHVYF